MAPARPREPSTDTSSSSSYDDFLNKLEHYHASRGTTLERDPKIGQRHINLLRLYERVCEEGGYDRVSDTKNNRLAWRRIAAEFLPSHANPTTQAFLIKTIYYKNLAAYEITDFHGKEPPPKEILEDISARGGDLLTRTKEKFVGSTKRGSEKLANGQEKDSDESEDDEQQTPKEDKMDIDEPGSTGGRVTRALRNAPPQRVLFQSEASATRQTRSSGHHNSPTPATNSYSQQNGVHGTSGNITSLIANYEPKPVLPSNVKPVTTPSNNPDYFRNLRNKLASRKSGLSYPNKGMMLPGTGFAGPNIYIRALLALKSGNVEEEAYALHHLVKISHERGDKYRFDGFPGLAEALVERLLEISTLFYGVRWEICYVEDDSLLQRNDILNGISGTSDLLNKIHSHALLALTDDEVQTKDFSEALGRVHEAGLVVRNLVMLDANAYYVSQLPQIRDFITIALNLPRRASVVELKHYALEIAEQLTRYWIINSDHPLYQTLLAQLDSNDRALIITSLRALSRIAMSASPSYELLGIPARIVQQVCEWMLVEDEHLREACLDFLYLYTTTTENVATLAESVDIEGLVRVLTRLLLHNAQTTRMPAPSRLPARAPPPAPETAAKLAGAVIEQLIAADEPDRSSQWLKTCFEEDPSGEITQIALWTAYNAAFNGPIQKAQAQHQASSLPSTPGSNAPPANQGKPPKPLMAAKDFITNVSTTFPTASAQVVNSGGTSKYTIKGIRPRTIPVDLRNRPFIKCMWLSDSAFSNGPKARGEEECGEFVKEAKQMWDHVLSTHLGCSKDANGKWHVEDSPTNGVKEESATPDKKYDCLWGGCRRFSRNGEGAAVLDVARHVITHLPDGSEKAPQRNQHNRSVAASAAPARTTDQHPQQALYGPYGPPNGRHVGYNGTRMDPLSEMKWLNTAFDGLTVAQGLSGGSVMVLRNLARRLVVVSAGRGAEAGVDVDAGDGGGEKTVSVQGENLVRKAFAPVMEELFFVMAHNQSLKESLHDLICEVVDVDG
ncbi:RSC complex subunit Rsc9 [Phyllosticta citrichinensis]|uniref:RSC complex subunit Rsc9 n=1 Tax=Phyllosticta citrichinensis TaxID=1130410 RepID=A0ABR1Y6W0_9PEZI